MDWNAGTAEVFEPQTLAWLDSYSITPNQTNGDYHFSIVPLYSIRPTQCCFVHPDWCLWRGTSSCAISNSRHCELISTSLTRESISKSILTTTTATWPQKGTCFVAADRFLCGTAKKRSYVCDSHRRPTDGTRPNTDRTLGFPLDQWDQKGCYTRITGGPHYVRLTHLQSLFTWSNNFTQWSKSFKPNFPQGRSGAQEEGQWRQEVEVMIYCNWEVLCPHYLEYFECL